jgi:hypothetical protein
MPWGRELLESAFRSERVSMTGLLTEAPQAVNELFSERLLRFQLRGLSRQPFDDNAWYEIIFCSLSDS